jgi:hypothetical protein
MFLHLIFVLLATVPFFAPSALASKYSNVVQRQNAPFQQVCLLKASVIVANSPFSPVLSHRQTNANAACISPDPANTVTDRLNAALNSSGSGFVLHLCSSAQYFIQAPILFAAPNQEISTSGYPTDNSRATLVVSGPVANGQGHTTAIDGTCANCSGIILRNIQVRVPVPFPFIRCLRHRCVIARSMELAPGLLQLSVEQI